MKATALLRIEYCMWHQKPEKYKKLYDNTDSISHEKVERGFNQVSTIIDFADKAAVFFQKKTL